MRVSNYRCLKPLHWQFSHNLIVLAELLEFITGPHASYYPIKDEPLRPMSRATIFATTSRKRVHFYSASLGSAGMSPFST